MYTGQSFVNCKSPPLFTLPKPSARPRAREPAPNSETRGSPLRRRDQTRSAPPRPLRAAAPSRSPPGGRDPQNPKPWRGRVWVRSIRAGFWVGLGPPARQPWRPSTAPTWSSTRRSSTSPTSLCKSGCSLRWKFGTAWR